MSKGKEEIAPVAPVPTNVSSVEVKAGDPAVSAKPFVLPETAVTGGVKPGFSKEKKSHEKKTRKDPIFVSLVNSNDAANLLSVGIPVIVGPGDSRPHAYSAGLRSYVEQKQCFKIVGQITGFARAAGMWNTKTNRLGDDWLAIKFSADGKSAKFGERSIFKKTLLATTQQLYSNCGVGVLFPREYEVKLINDALLAANLPAIAEGHRPEVKGMDAVRGRVACVAPHFDLMRIFVFNDASYYFSPEEFVDLFKNNVYVRKEGIFIHSSSFNFRTGTGKGRTIYLDRVSHGIVKVPTIDGEELEVKAATTIQGFAVVNAYPLSRKCVHYRAGVAEAPYDHENKGTWLHEYKRLVVAGDATGYWVITNWCEQPFGGEFLKKYYMKTHLQWFPMSYTAGPDILVDQMTRDALVYDGIMGWLVPMLAGRAGNVDVSDRGQVSAFVTVAWTAFHNYFSADLIKPYFDLFDEIGGAVVNTATYVLGARPALELGIAPAPIKEATITALAGHLQERTNLPYGLCYAIADIKSQVTKFDAAVAAWTHICEFFTYLWAKLGEWWSGELRPPPPGTSDYEMEDLAELSFLTKVGRVISHILGKFKASAGILGYLNNLKNKVAAVQPLWLEMLLEAAVSLLSTFVEEWLKHSPLGWVWALALSVVESLMDLFLIWDGTRTWVEWANASIHRIVFHLVLRFLPFELAIVAHAAHNLRHTVALYHKKLELLKNMFLVAVASLPWKVEKYDKTDVWGSTLYSVVGGVKMPINTLEMWSTYSPPEVETRKWVLINSELNTYLGKPTQALHDALNLCATRLSAVPKYQCTQKVKPVAAAWVDWFGGEIVAYDYDQLRKYFNDREAWPARKKADWFERVKVAEGCPVGHILGAERVIVIKIDEMLWVKITESNMKQLVRWLKVRPIYPANVESVHSMAIGLPFKIHVSQEFILARTGEGGAWSCVSRSVEHLKGEPFVVVHSFIFVALYVPVINSQILTLIHRRYDASIVNGIVWLKMGDDSKLLLYLDGVRWEQGFDIAMCDQSCGEKFHDFVGLIDRACVVHPMIEDYALCVDEMERLGMQGRFRVEVKDDTWKEPIFFEKPFMCTNTGGARTSLYAELSQDFVMVPVLWDMPVMDGMELARWCYDNFLDLVMQKAKKCGFDYQPDLLIDGKIQWSRAGTVSFLAMVVTPAPAYAIPINWFKQHHFGPSMPAGIGESEAFRLIERHHAAWSVCPDRVITPLDAAYAEWHAASAMGAVADWSDYVRTEDEWHQAKWKDYVPFACPPEVFYDTMQLYAEVRGFKDPTLEIQQWIGILKTSVGCFSATPPSFLLESRFGPLKVGSDLYDSS